MKRLIALALLCCLLLCACGKPEAPTVPATEAPTEAPTEETTEASQTGPVTVYLLTEVFFYDSGYNQYRYDDDHNINTCGVFDMENQPIYDTFFEEKDANGMAKEVRVMWTDATPGDTRLLTYSEDGKLQEELIAGSNFTGSQYVYDDDGNRIEKRDYYEGILEATVYCEYEAGVLTAAYSEDAQGNKVYECRIENGRILEKVFYDYESEYGYLYEYDDNGNMIGSTYYFEGESHPAGQYLYAAVEVDAQRAPYLLAQQAYLLGII